MIVLINGVNQKSVGLSDSYPTEKIAIPVEAIERIEIIRGPMSVIYGSGAFFGAINIITTSEKISKPVTGNASVSYGSMNTKKISLLLQGKSNEFSYSFIGGIFVNDGINKAFNKLMTNYTIATLPIEEGGWNLKLNSTEKLLKTNRKYFNLSTKYKNFNLNFGIVSSKKKYY